MHARRSMSLLAVGQSYLTTLSSASTLTKIPSATGVGGGSLYIVGARSRWQFARPLFADAVDQRAEGNMWLAVIHHDLVDGRELRL